MHSLISIAAVGILSGSAVAHVLPRYEALDYGSCTNPTINWDRDQGFYPDNTKDFPHGPAPDITTIANYICAELKNRCKCSEDTFEACFGANVEASLKYNGEPGQAQADIFKNYLLTRKGPDPAPTPDPPEPPKPDTTPTVDIQFSKDYVDIEGHVDPKWWFDNKLVSSGAGPQQCDPGADKPPGGFRMPGDYWMTYSCGAANLGTMNVMRAVLNGVVDATVDNTTANDNERIFKHITKTKLECNLAGCHDHEMKYTRFPRSVGIVTSGVLGGDDWWKGSLNYDILQITDSSCSVCSLFSSGGAGTAAWFGARAAAVESASALTAPLTAFVFAGVSFGCFGACSS